ncbi:bidirectional sugar transporter SWEET9 [Gossypium arboreum]|uniref:Bidirectional sugar transporter SWEET n=1 Tax=Gossypium arboreum TaxID=29729 RepID=A0ABR0MI37_GOSAR|nr:bidirectional sugar transporter SWEET9 [Gossypium arboreum]KAK5772934.1 hypothetical protein PVK06_049236 [Gossypium arboreum]
MGFFGPHHQLAFIFGVLGSIVSFMVFLSPVKTFYTIYKKRTAEGYQSIPYMVALSSSMMLLYYGMLKTNANLIVGISCFGCAIEIIYLILYIVYAPKRDKVFTVKWIILFNLGGYCLIMVATNLFRERSKRVTVMGWVCAVNSVAVSASPLGIMRRVIRTKSVEYMPFLLSFFLTLCSTMWFFYGLFLQDLYVAFPNVLGFLLGTAQIVIYVIYKNGNKGVEITEKMQKGDMEGSVRDINPCFPDHEQEIKEITIVIAEKPVESDEMKA